MTKLPERDAISQKLHVVIDHRYHSPLFRNTHLFSIAKWTQRWFNFESTFRLSLQLKLGCMLGVVLVSECLIILPCLAQIVPNGLGTRIDQSDCSSNCTVTGGSRQNTNLFHSFEEFSVPRNRTVTFQHDGAIANIITRVTGGSISRINGTIQTLLDGSADDVGTADFFFINPSGIVFGANAQLNLGGSFIGSTAETLQFDDGTDFSVNDANPLLTISVPTGLQFGTDPSDIRVVGPGNNLFLNSNDTVNRSDRPTGLSVLSGNTLALIGGDLNLNGGNLTSEAGRIELGAVGNNSDVTFVEKRSGWRANYQDVETFGDIQFSDAASVDVSGNNAGRIYVRGGDIQFQDGSSLLANTLVSGDGHLSINAAESLQMSGTSSLTLPETARPIPSSAYIEIAPGATGNGRSEISVTTPNLTITDGAQIGLSMAGLGLSGVVTVNADQIVADRDSPTAFSGVFAAVLPVFPGETDPFPPSLGAGGDLVINTDRLQISNGAQILASTFGLGDAGALTVNAQDIEIFGFSTFGPSGIQAGAEFPPSGNGGQLTIDTARLTIRDGGQIATSTKSFTQSAGDLVVRATDSIELEGTTILGSSGLFAPAVSLRNPATGEVAQAAGAGGSIFIETPNLLVKNGATINVSSNPSNPNNPGLAPGTGPAGDLIIDADLIQLDDQALITADTVNGDRANITIQSDLVTLRNGSLLTTSATGTATGGDLSINTGTLAAFDNSDITANAQNNFGGRVIVTADGLFGTQFRPVLTSQSDITATSALGAQFSGVVALNTPDVDPSRSTAELPSGISGEEAQIQSVCEPTTRSALLLVGPGGLPQQPYQSSSGAIHWQDFRLAEYLGANTITTIMDQVGRGDRDSAHTPVARTVEPGSIQEAHNWVIETNGQVNLVSRTQQGILRDPLQHSAQCGEQL